MNELDREAMGRRIRQIRTGAGLRQWELAKLLGTTQSAVHKYEHGVVPEPRRLVELSRIGGTSIEWVLTGTHWENGSQSQGRLSPEVLNTACLLQEIGENGRNAVDEALRIVREAVAALRASAEGNGPASLSEDASTSLNLLGPQTLQLLQSAVRIHYAILGRIAADAEERISRHKPFSSNGNRPADADPGEAATRRRP